MELVNSEPFLNCIGQSDGFHLESAAFVFHMRYVT